MSRYVDKGQTSDAVALLLLSKNLLKTMALNYLPTKLARVVIGGKVALRLQNS